MSRGWAEASTCCAGSAPSTCKASSVPGRLHLETSKAATPRCPGCFSVGLDARREHETLGAILDCSRRRQQSVCSPPPLWMWKGVQRKLQMCQSRSQVHYSIPPNKLFKKYVSNSILRFYVPFGGRFSSPQYVDVQVPTHYIHFSS